MLYNIVTDTHLFGADPTDIDLNQIPEDAIFLGDIIDLKNCHKDKTKEAMSLFLKLKSFKKEKYINGNHECQCDIDTPLIMNEIAFMHGDRILYGYEKHKERRNHDTDGAGGFQRLWKGAFSKLRNVIEWNEDKLSNPLIIDEITNIALAYKVKTIVIGHAHPSKIIDQIVYGVRIIVCPRGHSKLEL